LSDTATDQPNKGQFPSVGAMSHDRWTPVTALNSQAPPAPNTFAGLYPGAPARTNFVDAATAAPKKS
jgi:hypothetical protein